MSSQLLSGTAFSRRAYFDTSWQIKFKEVLFAGYWELQRCTYFAVPPKQAGNTKKSSSQNVFYYSICHYVVHHQLRSCRTRTSEVFALSGIERFQYSIFSMNRNRPNARVWPSLLCCSADFGSRWRGNELDCNQKWAKLEYLSSPYLAMKQIVQNHLGRRHRV